MARRVVTVFGGSGFLGRHIVRRLAAAGATVRVAVRDVEAGLFLRTMGDPGQIVLMAANVREYDSVKKAVAGADAVINLVGILSPWAQQKFDAVHVQGAENIAKAAAEAGCSSLVHLSAIGADKNSEAEYARTKGLGEEAVLANFPKATILRPSVVFGPEDNFFNRFAGLMRLTPFLPVIGCPLLPKISFEDGLKVDLYGDGGAKFQPVYVGDVAQAAVNALESAEAKGKTYELGGPKVMSMKQIMELLLSVTERKRFLLPVTFGLARFKGSLLGLLPNPVLTADQVKMMEKPNVVSEGALGLAALGVSPTLAEVIVPTYLHRYRTPTYQRVRNV